MQQLRCTHVKFCEQLAASEKPGDSAENMLLHEQSEHLPSLKIVRPLNWPLSVVYFCFIVPYLSILAKIA